jgi:hypothetical protein
MNCLVAIHIRSNLAPNVRFGSEADMSALRQERSLGSVEQVTNPYLGAD